MTTRITTNGAGTGVTPTSTAPRVTPAPAEPFKNMLNAGAQAVVDGAQSAVNRLPGGPVLAAAVRPGHDGAVVGSAAAPGAQAATGPTGTASAGGTASGSTPTGGGIESVLAQNADQNLYFLQLQERISAESRAYSALSNILKARHDTVKNAIGNIR